MQVTCNQLPNKSRFRDPETGRSTGSRLSGYRFVPRLVLWDTYFDQRVAPLFVGQPTQECLREIGELCGSHPRSPRTRRSAGVSGSPGPIAHGVTEAAAIARWESASTDTACNFSVEAPDVVENSRHIPPQGGNCLPISPFARELALIHDAHHRVIETHCSVMESSRRGIPGSDARDTVELDLKRIKWLAIALARRRQGGEVGVVHHLSRGPREHVDVSRKHRQHGFLIRAK